VVQGYELLHEMEPYIHQVREHIDKLNSCRNSMYQLSIHCFECIVDNMSRSVPWNSVLIIVVWYYVMEKGPLYFDYQKSWVVHVGAPYC
jgi:hypothetical protein